MKNPQYSDRPALGLRSLLGDSRRFRIPPSAGAAAVALGLLSSSTLSAQVLVAGIDTWDSSSAPTVNVTAPGITATATASGTNGNWAADENGDSGRGASNDGTWGTFGGGASAPTTAISPNGNFSLTNAKPSAEITLTITNNGASALDLNAFHMDAVAFRPKAARGYQVDVLAGSDITVGNVFTSDQDQMNDNSTNDITHLSGGLSGNDQHDDLDIDLTGLADSTLLVGETAIIQVTFSGGADDGSGGHHLFLDNVAVSSVATTTDKLVVTSVPMVDTVAGTDFSVTIEAQDSGGSPINVSQDTDVTLSSSGTGALTGNTGTILMGQSSVTLTVVNATVAETITASAFRTSGDDLLGSDPSPSFTIIPDSATDIFVETAADGSGEVVPDTLMLVGDFLDVFAISRDTYGNFVANEATATFALANITGNILADDLDTTGPAGSATLEAFDTGTCNIRASLGGFADADSGLITISELVNRYDGGTNSSPNWSTAIVWLGDVLPDFNNETDLFFTTNSPTKRSTYLGPDGGTTKIVRSITVDEASDVGLNMSFVENGSTGTVNLIFDTDSMVDPAELNVDVAYEGNILFGATNTSQAEAGDVILADDLKITHNGLGLLNVRVDITEMGGSYGVTKEGTGTAQLSGVGSYTGTTAVNAGVLRVTGQSIADAGRLNIANGAGVVDVEADENVQFLSVDGGTTDLPDGEYGSTDSGAVNVDDTHFTGLGKIIVGPPPVGGDITITGITHSGTDATITFTSTTDVDVYRSTDLLDFGATPYAEDVPSGTYTDTAANGVRHFYILVTANDPAP